MSDPRNAAHDRKVAQEKKHHGAEPPVGGGSSAQPGKKARKKAPPAPPEQTSVSDVVPGEVHVAKPSPTIEGSRVVLAQLKDMAFHSQALSGRLAELMLTVEEKLKQKGHAITVGEIYSAQDVFHTQLTGLIESYAAECDRLQAESE